MDEKLRKGLDRRSFLFMNKEEGERVLAACKEKNIGTTAMKTSPGLLHLDPLDPDNPTVKQESLLKELEERGLSREQALDQFYDYLRRDRKQEGSDEETIMRYSYYFAMQRREKYAMGKYANLDGKTAEQCMNCHAPCVHACPHGVNIQANMKTAHSLLTLA